jgi:hypothetical protein
MRCGGMAEWLKASRLNGIPDGTWVQILLPLRTRLRVRNLECWFIQQLMYGVLGRLMRRDGRVA